MYTGLLIAASWKYALTIIIKLSIINKWAAVFLFIYVANLLVHSLAILSCSCLSLMYWFAMLPTRGSTEIKHDSTYYILCTLIFGRDRNSTFNNWITKKMHLTSSPYHTLSKKIVESNTIQCIRGKRAGTLE